ncbi:hypothetical protein BC835DRAFT_1346646 [Cytidiella melzeri]|nr:hypothetical protein BC835DRAFT_1346646 [Cytidiella melzeri]
MRGLNSDDPSDLTRCFECLNGTSRCGRTTSTTTDQKNEHSDHPGQTTVSLLRPRRPRCLKAASDDSDCDYPATWNFSHLPWRLRRTLNVRQSCRTSGVHFSWDKENLSVNEASASHFPGSLARKSSGSVVFVRECASFVLPAIILLTRCVCVFPSLSEKFGRIVERSARLEK